MFAFDLSLNNIALYMDCEIEEVGGKKNLLTPPFIASNIIGKNAERLIDTLTIKNEVVLTGGMAIWAYLIVFHQVVHRFKKVYYDDGKGGELLLIAAHG